MARHQTASEKTPLYQYVILWFCCIALIFAGLAHAGIFASPFAEKPVPLDWTPPEGYQLALTANSNIKYGYKWDTVYSKTCDFGDECWVLYVVSSRNCKAGMGISVSYLDSEGVIVRRAHKSISVRANKITSLAFTIYPDKPDKILITRVGCEVDK